MSKHAHDLGFQHDLAVLTRRALSRRTMLRWTFGAGVVSIIGCEGGSLLAAPNGGGGLAAGSGSGAAGASAGSDAGSCSDIPEETAGPYPGDGSNGANALALSGIVRSDIRSSIGSASGIAEGVPLDITLSIVNTADGCAPLAGCAVYLWHCDRAGLYSMYSPAVADQNYLRGVQETDGAGQVTFKSIFPACYSGRWPHIHFEVYPSLGSITSAANKLATSQLALPEDACNTVFAQAGYEQSVGNLARVTLASDNVFSDGVSSQLGSIGGSVSAGLTTELLVPISV